ncbi:hypothetical protein ACLOJK_003977 [Asimina triloba]
MGGYGRDPSKHHNQYHNDTKMVIVLLIGRYNDNSRCLKKIRINANGGFLLAKVIDECDFIHGSDYDHDYQPLSLENIMDVFPTV